jgi:hypothetical protein
MLSKLGEKRLVGSKPIFVLNATPIIRFARIRRLKLLVETCGAYIIREVYQETVEHGQGKPNAATIRDAVAQTELRVYHVRDARFVTVIQRHLEIRVREA